MAKGGVLLLDDDDDLLATLSELVRLLTNGPCLAVSSLSALIARRDEALACTRAILDINLGPGQPSGLDAYAWLKRERFAGSIVFLTGQARSHPLVGGSSARSLACAGSISCWRGRKRTSAGSRKTSPSTPSSVAKRSRPARAPSPRPVGA